MSSDLSYLSSDPAEKQVMFTLLGSCTGVQKLAQKAITLLLTSGADPLRFGAGGGTGELVGRSSLIGDALRNRLNLDLAKVTELIKMDQRGDQSLADEDKLSTLSLAKLEQHGASVEASIYIVSVAGESTYASLTVGQQP